MKTVAMVTGTSRGLTLAKKAPKYYSFELIFLESTTAYEVLHGIFLFLLTSGFNRKNKIGWQPWPLNIMGFQISHTFCFIFSCFGDISTYACYISINIFFFSFNIFVLYLISLCFYFKTVWHMQGLKTFDLDLSKQGQIFESICMFLVCRYYFSSFHNRWHDVQVRMHINKLKTKW